MKFDYFLFSCHIVGRKHEEMEGEFINIEPAEGREQVDIFEKCKGMRARLKDSTTLHSLCEQTEVSSKNEMYEAREILFFCFCYFVFYESPVGEKLQHYAEPPSPAPSEANLS